MNKININDNDQFKKTNEQNLDFLCEKLIYLKNKNKILKLKIKEIDLRAMPFDFGTDNIPRNNYIFQMIRDPDMINAKFVYHNLDPKEYDIKNIALSHIKYEDKIKYTLDSILSFFYIIEEILNYSNLDYIKFISDFVKIKINKDNYLKNKNVLYFDENTNSICDVFIKKLNDNLNDACDSDEDKELFLHKIYFFETMITQIQNFSKMNTCSEDIESSTKKNNENEKLKKNIQFFFEIKKKILLKKRSIYTNSSKLKLFGKLYKEFYPYKMYMDLNIKSLCIKKII